MSRYFVQVVRDMWRGLLVAVALPLRLMTGRWHPDYQLISRLELELGLREPENFIEQFAGPSLASRPGRRVEIIDLQPKKVIGSKAWQAEYERGRENALQWLRNLD